ncbi:hypothetical protein BET10_18170 [Pseudoalteromonas amylolytica]|uniref:Uncharacterized protein n=1 Tax=Pseudoalteromonas amylolytica TaxID=1859457 RepID=A0A1S1MPY1_9GAMM|nr:hypothetical protein BET10_18170 [Pseudoalteromonas amylolytica]
MRVYQEDIRKDGRTSTWRAIKVRSGRVKRNGQVGKWIGHRKWHGKQTRKKAGVCLGCIPVQGMKKKVASRSGNGKPIMDVVRTRRDSGCALVFSSTLLFSSTYHSLATKNLFH